MTRAIKFVVFPQDTPDGYSGLWYVKTVGGNGETEDVSEAYSTKWTARRAAIRRAKRLGSGVAWQLVIEEIK